MSDQSSLSRWQTASRSAIVALIVALSGATACWPGSGWSNGVSPNSGTRVFDEHGKQVGVVAPVFTGFGIGGEIAEAGGSAGVEWEFRTHQIVYFREEDCLDYDCGWGYARMLPGGFWYVEAFFEKTPYVRTIGSVRRRNSQVWDAYLGLGAQARRIGWATGVHAGVGAVARLLVFSSEPGREWTPS